MRINIISKSGRVPKYETAGSAGFDVSAYLNEPMVLKAGERALVSTGLFIELPVGYEAQVRARSGLSIKNGIGLVNGIGTIDSDYRGELMIPLINWSKDDFTITDGMRIAQVVINKYETIEFNLSESLEETVRGAGGFGHTGV